MGLSIFQSLGLLLNPLDTADFNIDGIAAMDNFSVVRSLCQPPHQHTWDVQAVKMFWPSWVIVP